MNNSGEKAALLVGSFIEEFDKNSSVEVCIALCLAHFITIFACKLEDMVKKKDDRISKYDLTECAAMAMDKISEILRQEAKSHKEEQK